jgi:histidine ammonia-lyase
MSTVIIDGSSLSLENIVSVARKNYKISISEDAKGQVNISRKYVEKIVNSGKAVYGINTGFGKFSDVSISKKTVKHFKEILLYHMPVAMVRVYQRKL